MRAWTAAALVLALLAQADAAAPAGTFVPEAAADGSVDLSALNATLAYRSAGPGAFRIHADVAVIRAIDDQDADRIPNPLNPGGDDLYSSGSRDTDITTLGDATLTFVPMNETAVALLFSSPASSARLSGPGRMALHPVESKLLEKTHYTSSDTLFGASVTYRYDAGPGVQATPSGGPWGGTAHPARLYVWGGILHAESPTRTADVATGVREDPSSRPGTLGTKHVVHAIVEFVNATATLEAAPDALYAPSLTVFASSIRLSSPEGALAAGLAASGPQVLHGTTLSFTRGGPGQLSAVSVPVPPAPGAPAWLPAAGFAAAAVALGLLAAPWLVGRALRRPEDRASPARAVAWGRWAAWAEGHGHARWAAWCGRRACACDPFNPDRFLERGIYLRAAGQPKAARVAHEHANRLYEAVPDDAQRALNAWQAALACSDSGQMDAAADWLELALQVDPELAVTVAQDPGLRGLVPVLAPRRDAR